VRDVEVLPHVRIRWVDLPGAAPARLYLHGLGCSSAYHFTPAATHPLLAGRRSLLLDLLGFGISDRPASFDYTISSHADVLATALTSLGLEGLEVVAHSMGGAVAVSLASRHPSLVARLALIDSNLDPATPRPAPGSIGIATYTESEFLKGVGYERTLRRAGPAWAATMRLADPVALYRTAVDLVRTTARQELVRLEIPRLFLHPAGWPPADVEGLEASGVRVVEVPDSGHNIMIDNVDGFASALTSDW
jgi:pimeloyl-ACP methyl ester carboxylesterase